MYRPVSSGELFLYKFCESSKRKAKKKKKMSTNYNNLVILLRRIMTKNNIYEEFFFFTKNLRSTIDFNFGRKWILRIHIL